jgi:hypothetical protein
MRIEIVSIKPKVIDSTHVTMQILIDYDLEFKNCVCKVLKKKTVSKIEIEQFVTNSLQQVINEMDNEDLDFFEED